MKNDELIKKLSELPRDLTIMFKVAQEITGYEDFGWMRGDCTGVSVEDLYEGDDDMIWDRDRMFDEVYDDPEKYGLQIECTDSEIEEFISKKKKETVIAIEVHP